LAFTKKKDDKITVSGHGVVSADGKTCTVPLTGTDSTGKKNTSNAVYDKQQWEHRCSKWRPRHVEARDL